MSGVVFAEAKPADTVQSLYVAVTPGAAAASTLTVEALRALSFEYLSRADVAKSCPSCAPRILTDQSSPFTYASSIEGDTTQSGVPSSLAS